MRIVKRLTIAGLLASAFLCGPAQATTTFCSNLRREMVKDSYTVTIPVGISVAEFHRRFDVQSSALGMSFAQVTGRDPQWTYPEITTILQSPEVSVAIHVRTGQNQRSARIDVWRTCINDSLEPWRPYRDRVVGLLRQNHYVFSRNIARIGVRERD